MEKTEPQINKCLDVISNENCSIIVFYHAKEISGMLQLQKIRFSLSFDQQQFTSLLAICENSTESAGQYRIFKHAEEMYPIILQVSNDVRLFLSEKEWQDVCHVMIQTKTKYYTPSIAA